MVDKIPLTWYYETPIDLEHKQYFLWAYLQKVDESFNNKQLSPYFLHLHKIYNELTAFKENVKKMVDLIENYNNRFLFMEPEQPFSNSKIELLETVNEIVEFSIPEVKMRIEKGETILTFNKQILF